MSAKMIWNCLPNGEEPNWKKLEAIELATCQPEKIGKDIFWQRVDQLEIGKEVIHTIYGRYKRNFGGEVVAIHDSETVKDCLYRANAIIHKHKKLQLHNYLIY